MKLVFSCAMLLPFFAAINLIFASFHGVRLIRCVPCKIYEICPQVQANLVVILLQELQLSFLRLQRLMLPL